MTALIHDLRFRRCILSMFENSIEKSLSCADQIKSKSETSYLHRWLEAAYIPKPRRAVTHIRARWLPLSLNLIVSISYLYSVQEGVIECSLQEGMSFCLTGPSHTSLISALELNSSRMRFVGYSMEETVSYELRNEFSIISDMTLHVIIQWLHMIT